ncbi:hypothetical protein EDB81DRAFT_761562 [Dactylonectria macrodidyma]|uniref:Uncharacterized protein n=1 Tax=Dactylonectria macrodidyma TaxID=307937 RepID=A0A9P9ENY5_9HYPO|nr:hypothetical protein EDB81DRAFT_761562 [Dactylonectria macrodidyma]
MALTVPTLQMLPPEALTTVWTYPTECASKTPNLAGGHCVELVCEQVGVRTDFAFVNYPYETAPFEVAISSCWPPDFYHLAYYSPAIACPEGFVTASTGSPIPAQVTTGFESFVFCCPSQFPSIFTTHSWSACMTTSTMTEPTDLPIAMEVYLTATTSVTNLVVTETYYKSESTVGTYYYSGSEVVTLLHPPVQMYIPEAMKHDVEDSDQSSAKGFTLFGMSYVVSIAITAGISLAGLISLCCCFYFCRSCQRRRREGKRRSQSESGGLSGYSPRPFEMSCSHGLSQHCSRPPNSDCCACRDTRTPQPLLDKRERTSTYCQPCKEYWAVAPPTLWPPSWRSSPPTPPQASGTPCPHQTMPLCLELRGYPVQCCTCRDKRIAVLSKAQRLESCCQTCKLFWQDIPPKLCPREWKLDELQCPHNRSQACQEVNGGEASCCACKDDRTMRLSKTERMGLYCTSCIEFWNKKPVGELPSSWRLVCGHGAIGKTCIFADEVGCCCACTDGRTGELSKEKRLNSYCLSCKRGWNVTTVQNCPPEWKLRCSHNRAWAWEAAAPVVRGRTGPCCCACRDSSKGYKTKKRRLSSYCFECRMFWEGTQDVLCPKEWGLSGCAHDGLSRTCERSGLPKDRCCACTDTRKDPIQKMARTKTYCASCQKSWSGTSDAACPPEWRLGEVRTWTTTCQAHPAARCCVQTTDQVQRCCACRDLEKKGTIPHRSAAYCSECSIYWNKQPAQAWPFPVSSTDEWLYQTFPTLKLLPNGKIPSARIHFPEEPAPNFQLLDEGPRYGPVRLGTDNPINQVSPSSTTKVVSASNPETHPAEKPWRPQRDVPHRARAVTREERQRQKDQEGLQYGAPRFAVGLDGTLQ